MILISLGKAETNEERKKMQEKCEKRKKKDMEVLGEESKIYIQYKIISIFIAHTYEVNVKKEYFYFEYINLIRQNARKVMVKTNLDN